MTYIHTGFAIWDGDIKSGLDASFYPDNFDAVEIQLASEELILNPPKSILRIARDRAFKSVHSSDKICNQKKLSCDLSSKDETESTLLKYAILMDFADRINANIFIIHPCAYQYLDNLYERVDRMSTFYFNFKRLLDVYREREYRFNIAVENLEFDKFPSTLDELVFMLDTCKKIAIDSTVSPDKIKLCWDIQHSRHSIKIINEPWNHSRFSAIESIGNLLPGFLDIHRKFFGVSYNESKCDGDLYDTALTFVQNALKNMAVVHVAGNEDITSTHESLEYKSRDYIYPPWSLDVRQVVNILMDNDFDGALIIEDHNPLLDKKIQSVRTVQQYIVEKLSQ